MTTIFVAGMVVLGLCILVQLCKLARILWGRVTLAYRIKRAMLRIQTKRNTEKRFKRGCMLYGSKGTE